MSKLCYVRLVLEHPCFLFKPFHNSGDMQNSESLKAWNYHPVLYIKCHWKALNLFLKNSLYSVVLWETVEGNFSEAIYNMQIKFYCNSLTLEKNTKSRCGRVHGDIRVLVLHMWWNRMYLLGLWLLRTRELEFSLLTHS